MKIKQSGTFIILAAVACLGADQAGVKPVSAVVIPATSGNSSGESHLGDIKVTFSDGHTEVVTHDGKCSEPKASKKGDVGWVHCTNVKESRYGPHGENERLVVRSLSGKTREFKPSSMGPFIHYWDFTANDSAVVMSSTGFHGPTLFIKYELTSGKVTAEVSSAHCDNDYNKLPKWAQPAARGTGLDNAPQN